MLQNAFMELIRLQADHLARLTAWSAAWLVLAVVAMARRQPDPAVRSFWLVTALWCLINLAVAAFAAGNPTKDSVALRGMLIGSEAFNVLCVLVGVALARRPDDRLRGAGVAVAAQATALLVLDGVLLSALP